MLAYLIVALCLLILVAGILSSRILMRIDMITYGLFFGAFYFLFFPLLVLLITGKLEVPWWLSSVNIGLRDIVIGDQVQSLFILLLYILGLFGPFLLMVITARKKSRDRTKLIDTSKEVQIYFASIALYFLLSVFILFASGILSGGHWYATKAVFRSTSNLALIISYLTWGLRIIIVAYTFELLDKKELSGIVAVLVIVTVCLFELRFVGNRIVVLMFGITGLIYLYRKYGFLKLAPFGLALIPIALILVIYTQIRSILFSAPVSQIIATLFSLFKTADFKATFLNVFEYSDIVVLLNLFIDMGQSIAPAYGSTFLRLVTWLIPRSIWVNKPLNLSLLIGNIYTPGVAPNLLEFGEFHYNFINFGPLLFPLLIFGVFLLMRMVSKKLVYRNYFYFLVGFLIFRFTVSDTFIFVIFTVLIYLLLSFIVRVRIHTTKSQKALI